MQSKNCLKLYFVTFCIICATVMAGPSSNDVTPLCVAGYTVLPEPRSVELSGRSVSISSEWVVETANLDGEDIVISTLLSDMRSMNGLNLHLGHSSVQVIHLSVESGRITTGASPGIEAQAYELTVDSDRIELVGNGRAGLFYGVQTLLQLVRNLPDGRSILPECKILDWPATELRFQHWDTKHHQDRLEVLKRYLDWSARFKFNMIGFELEDKFSYPSHPVIGAPGAFTPDQLQEIVDYGLERHIQVVPQIQSPAHMAYVLKHPEFSHLRSDGSNYQICLCNEESYRLIFDMYQDIIDATQGVDYFHVSTDEAYYAGICQKCDRPYNPENRSLAWVEFVQRAYEFLSERGRKMLVWLEYPVLPEHVSLLPAGIIDGVWGNSYIPDKMPSVVRRQYLEAEEKRSIRQLAYVAIGSSDHMTFPRYFSQASRKGRLQLMMEQLNSVISTANPIGVYGAFWNDTGRHCELYWLGKATVAQYGWTPGKPSLEQTMAAFCRIYFGDSVDPVRLIEIYSGLQQQSSFFQESWDMEDARELKARYGESDGKRVIVRKNRTLPPPPLPDASTLGFEPVYTAQYSELSAEAAIMLERAAKLRLQVITAIQSADRNHYNLELLLSLIDYHLHHNQMIVNLRRIEDKMGQSAVEKEKKDTQQALQSLLEARALAEETIHDRSLMFASLKRIWERSHFPKGQSLKGQDFVHVLDDVKDHWADRRPDLSYLVAPEERIGLEHWVEQISEVILAVSQQSGGR